jgi:hypothetical protein
MPQGKSRKNPDKPAHIATRLLHREQFASFYDIRDDFEIGEPAENDGRKTHKKLIAERQQAIADVWTRDNGKPYYEAITRLAAENARMLRQFLLEQPPSDPAVEAGTPIIIALHERPPETPGKPSWELNQKQRRAKALDDQRKRIERLKDGNLMEKMTPAQRKVHMLKKQYENACLAQAVEAGPERLIARDQEQDVYYSFPVENVKIFLQSEIDENEFSDIVREYLEYEI